MQDFTRHDAKNPRNHLEVVEPGGLPDPPYPADTRANSWKPMIDWERVLVSEALEAAPWHIQNAILRLHIESWRCTPAASLPSSIRQLAIKARLAEADVHEHIDLLIDGWHMCSDKRLYNETFVPIVLRMITERKKERERKRKHRDSSDVRADNADVRADNAEVQAEKGHFRALKKRKENKTKKEGDPRGLALPSEADDGKPRSVARKIPSNWQPNERSLEWLRSEGVLNRADISRLVVSFRDFWIETGTRRANWDLVFRRNPVVKTEITKIRRAQKVRAESTIGRNPNSRLPA